jgi:hypothetical protein
MSGAFYVAAIQGDSKYYLTGNRFLIGFEGCSRFPTYDAATKRLQRLRRGGARVPDKCNIEREYYGVDG